ncbi:MAG TPA: tetratricopeptide repeat protein, partial [Burkholderiales bacterium]
HVFLHHRRRFLLLMPVAGLLWANAHTSILLMLLPFAAFLAAGLAQRALEASGAAAAMGRFLTLAPGLTPAQLRTVALVAVACVAASLASPYFVGQYLHSVKALASDWWKQEVAELRAPTWESYKLLYLFTAAVVLSFLANRRRISLPDLFLAVPLLALPFAAYRFMWFTALSAALLAKNLAAIAADHPRLLRRLESAPAQGAAALLAAVFTVLQILQLPPFKPIPDLQFGLGVSLRPYAPEGCLGYLDRQGVTGLVLNRFHFGGYITWRDFPRRRPFLDGRGFLDETLIESATAAPTKPALLDQLRARHPFESAVMSHTTVRDPLVREAGTSDLALSHPDWALVYWDDTCLVYLRRGGPYDPVIAADQYRNIVPSRGVQQGRLADPAYVAALAAELDRNIAATGSSMAYAYKGVLMNGLRRHREAIAAFSAVERHPSPRGNDLFDAYVGIAFAWQQLGSPAEAVGYYKKALAMQEDASVHQRLGLAYAALGDGDAAIRHYERALALNPALVAVYPSLAALYERAGRGEDAARARRLAEESQRSNQGERHFQAGTRAYLERNYPLAIAELQQSIAANPYNPAPHSNLGYAYFDAGNLDRAFEQHRRALELDPDAALSHYGIALVYRERGERALARWHWEQYLRLQPEGYFSRKARSEIENLK